jgi:replicative DNA helicase
LSNPRKKCPEKVIMLSKNQESDLLKYKMPPHNLEAEQTILGGILINNDALNQVVDILSSEDFYRESHAHIYEGMLSLYNRDDPVDLVTLSQVLREMDLLDKVGGTDYLASLAEATSTSAGIIHHAKIVKDLSTRRSLIVECSRISEACFEFANDTDEVLDLAEQSIFDIAERTIDQNFFPMNEVIKESFKKLESTSRKGSFITGVPTGFTDFDNLTSGLQPSDLIIIAGRPSIMPLWRIK